MTNIEKLMNYINAEGPELLPAFLRLLEVGFHGSEHGLEESKVRVADVSVGDDPDAL